MARLIFAAFLTLFALPLHELAACGPIPISFSYLFVPTNPGTEICSPGPETWDSDYDYASGRTVSARTPGSCFLTHKENIDAWVKFAGTGVLPSDVKTILYDQSQPPTTPSNSFGKFLSGSSPAAREALAYIQFAFQVEKYGQLIRQDAESWSEDQRKADPAKARTLFETAVKARAAATNSEIKQRYSYQILQLRFYQGDFAGVISEYEKSNMSQAVLPVQMRAKRVLAGALARTGKKEKAAAILGEILMKSADLLDAVHSDFHYIMPLDRAKVQTEARDPAARAGIQMLFGWDNPSYSLEFLKSASRDSFGSALILRMFLREVALFEENNISALLGHALDASDKARPPQEIPAAEKKHALALADFAELMQKSTPPNEQNAWAFYGAYMRYMGGQADRALKETEKLAGTPYWKEKARVLGVLARIDLSSRIDASLEKDIASLQPLFYQQEGRKLSPLRDFLLLKLERKYNAAGDRQKALAAHAAGMTLSRGSDLDVFGDEKSLPLLVDFLEKPNQSEFEKFLAAGMGVNGSDVRDRLGSLHLMNGRFADAEREFAKLSPAYLASLDRSYSGGLDPFGVDYADGSAEGKWDKLKFVREMIQTQKAAAAKDARASLRMASAYFNMSHQGRFWILTRTYRSYYDRYAYDRQLMNKALEYADKASTLTADKEMLARIAYQKALIQKGLLYFSLPPDAGEAAEEKRQKALFVPLSKFRGTQFYERYIEPCADYARAMRK